MMSSMTGFGRGEITRNGLTITVEIRSVNNRYCEISLKMPSLFQPMEQELRDVIQKQVDRGKLSITVRAEMPNDTTDTTPTFDIPTAKKLHAQLKELKSELNLTEPINLMHLMRFDSLYQSKETDSLNPETKAVLFDAVTAAINSLQAMRKQEGDHLKVDLTQRLSVIESTCAGILELSKERIPDARKKMADRVKVLLESDKEVDKDRLEQEIAFLADKLDITEEIVRMSSHIAYFRKAMDAAEPAGRKINFLIQEMHREVNTMGSKANHAGIAHMVVELKEILEIIREQIQNIE